MMSDIRTITNSRGVLEVGCEMMASASPNDPVRVISYLGRWYYPASGEVGPAPGQVDLEKLLGRQYQPHEPRPQIRLLLFCDDEQRVLSEESVAKFLEYGALVAHGPGETPVRIVTTGQRLLVAVNPADLASPGTLVSYGFYYRADGDDPMIRMVGEMFDARFKEAELLILDRKRKRISKGNPVTRTLRQLRARLTLAEVSFRLIWILISALIGLLFGLLIGAA